MYVHTLWAMYAVLVVGHARFVALIRKMLGLEVVGGGGGGGGREDIYQCVAPRSINAGNLDYN